MVLHYIQMLTVGWFDPEEFPPDDVTGYAPRLDDLRRQLRARGDAEPFRLGLAYLLATPGLDLARVAGTRYPYDADEVREILEYLWRELYGRPLPHTAPDLAFTDDALVEDWWVRRGYLHRVAPGETLRDVAAAHQTSVARLLDENPRLASATGPDVPLRPVGSFVRVPVQPAT